MIYGVTPEKEEEFYRRATTSIKDIVFAIETLEGKTIGNVGLHAINREWSNAEFRIVIGEKSCWGKGYCLEATRLMVKFAFDDMNLHRVYLKVNENNIYGIKCFEKVGFKKEGILREHRYYGGKYSNDLIMGIIRGELT